MPQTQLCPVRFWWCSNVAEVFEFRSAVGTIMASVGGGITSLLISRFVTRRIEVDMVIDGMLASLVSSSG